MDEEYLLCILIVLLLIYYFRSNIFEGMTVFSDDIKTLSGQMKKLRDDLKIYKTETHSLFRIVKNSYLANNKNNVDQNVLTALQQSYTSFTTFDRNKADVNISYTVQNLFSKYGDIDYIGYIPTIRNLDDIINKYKVLKTDTQALENKLDRNGAYYHNLSDNDKTLIERDSRSITRVLMNGNNIDDF